MTSSHPNLFALVLIVMLTSTSLFVVAADSNNSHTAQDKFPEFSWDYIPKYMHVYKITSYTAEELDYLASYPLITFEKTQGTRNGFVQEGTIIAANAVKALNPNAKILYYKNIVIDWMGSAMSKGLETIEGGYIKSKNGALPVANSHSKRKFFDISLPKVQDWWMKDATMMLNEPSIDGVFIDANIKVLVTEYFSSLKSTGEAKAKQLIAGYHQLLTRINEELRTDNIILANILRARFEKGGLEYMDYFDGSYLEAFEHNVGGVSRSDYIAKGIASAQEAARDGKIIAFSIGLAKALDKDDSGMGLDEARGSIENIESVEGRLNYVTAIFLVIAEKYSYFYPHDKLVVMKDRKGNQINRTWMKTLPVFEKRLGPPKGPAKKEGYVYTREFEYCSVWLDIENEVGRLTWR